MLDFVQIETLQYFSAHTLFILLYFIFI